EGDLVLRAGGDPSWTPELIGGASGHTKLTALAKEAGKNGLKHVKGDLVIDTGIYDVAEPIPPGWAWDNLDASYAGKPSALSFNENLVGVTVKPGRGDAPLDVSMAISSQAFEIINQSRTLGGGSAPTLKIDRSLDGRAVTIAGGLPQGSQGSTITFPTGKPVAMAAEVLRKALEKEGVVIDGRTRIDRNVERPSTQLAAVTGAPVSQTLKVCLRESDNFLAESLYLLASTKRFGSAGYLGAYKMETEYWKSIGVDPSEIHAADGSGLSREDFISPHALVSLLKANEKVDWFVDALPVSGQSGTLKYRLSGNGLAGRVIAKTGTLDSTSALSGYIKCPSGKVIIFSVMANNYTCSTNTIRAKIDDIVEMLAAR
ncbi:MAG: D-alanyl-D-alanine carboxypeptidase/D-alanyl-D-alanine-endopeptidase, partial [Candidatus Sumerlaeota bacterium]